MILRGEDVAGRPADRCAKSRQRLDQHGGLDGHVEAASDTGALERLGVLVFFAECHQAGHFAFSDGNFLAAPVCQGDVVYLVVLRGHDWPLLPVFDGSRYRDLAEPRKVWLRRT